MATTTKDPEQMTVEELEVICYHGTDQDGYRAISAGGFKEHTFFALHLEDAIGFGGPYVFGVAFPEEVKFGRETGDEWQFCAHDGVPKERIVYARYYRVVNLMRNSELHGRLFATNLAYLKRIRSPLRRS